MRKRFTSSVNLLCVLLRILCATNAVVVASFLGSSEPLVDWLDRLQIQIPDQSFSAQFLTIQLCNVSCTHFTISHIDSVYETAAPSAPQIQFTIREVAASCSGVYQASGGIHGTLSAQLAVGGEDDTNNSTNALEWTFQVKDDETTADTTMRMPGSIQSLYCTTHIVCTGLHFAGSSISAKLLELFHDVIIHAVNHAVRDQICPVLQPKADAMLSSYLQTAMHWLRPYLRPSLSPLLNDDTAYTATPVQLVTLDGNDDAVEVDVWSRNLLIMEEDKDGDDDNQIVDFETELPHLMEILHTVNRFVDTHLHHGVLPHSLLYNASSCGGLFDGMNGLLRLALPDTFTISIGSWIPTINFTLPRYAAVKLTVQNITLGGAGLSEWISLQILRPVDDSSSRNTTQFRTQLETPSNISIAIALTVRVQEVPGGIFHGDALVESFIVHVDMLRLFASLDLSMQLRRCVLERITLGMLVAGDHDLNCVIRAIRRMEVSNLIGAVLFSRFYVEPIPDVMYNDAYINQQLEFDIDHLINTVLELVISEYQEMTTSAIGGLIRSESVQNQINDYIAQRVISSNSTDCNSTPTRPDSSDHNQARQWFNFTSVELLHRLNTFLNLSRTKEKLNPYLDCTTMVLKNALHEQFVHPIFDFSNQSVTQFVDLDIQGAGSIQQVKLLLPTSADGLHLDSALIWASTDSEVRPYIFLSLNVNYVPLNVSAIVNVTLVVDDIHVVGGAVFPFDVGQFRQISFLKLLSNAQCAMTPVEKAGLHFYESENKMGFFEIMVNASLALLGQNDTMDISFHSNDIPDFQQYTSSVFEWSVGTYVDLMEAFIKVFLTVNSNQCTGDSADNQSTWSDPNTLPMKPLFLILFSVFLFLQPAVLFMKRPREVNTDSRSGANARQHVESTEPLLHPRYRGDELSEENTTIQRTVPVEPSCFMLDISIPEVARHVILIAIVVTVILLFVSNISVGATVEVLISGAEGGNPLFHLPPLFAFSLFNTASDMLKARIYPLFFLVVGFSGIWPYMKLFLMLFSWIGHKSVLCDEKRGDLLFKLDALSKFSLVDAYVLIVMLVAFRFHLPLVNESSLDVYVSPKFGFFGFLLATTFSLIIGHILLFFHRYASNSTSSITVEAEQPISARSPMPRRALGFTKFQMNDGSQRQVSKTGHFVFLFLLIAVVLLLFIGMTQKCFLFEIGGLAGLALGDGSRSAYSVLSFGEAIPSSTEHPSWISTRLLQFIFYFYTIAMPFMALTLLSILWVVPMQRSFQFPLMTLAEVSNAWSAIEVFCLSIIAALLEIETFTNFIIGHRCDWINQLLVQYHETVGVETCYSVAASVSWSGMFLVMGAILNSFLVSLALRVLHASLLERSVDGLGEDYSLSDANPSFVQKLAASRWSSWFLCELQDTEVSVVIRIPDSNRNATFLEDDVSNLLQYGEVSTDE